METCATLCQKVWRMETDQIRMSMHHLQAVVPWAYKLFMKIAEPRVVRLGFFGVYICLMSLGTTILLRPPKSFQNIDMLWSVLTLHFVLSSFLILGGLLSAASVLPGIWWLERTGLFVMGSGLLLFCIFSASPYVSIAIALVLVFALRWREIRKYQLAPLKIEPRKE